MSQDAESIRDAVIVGYKTVGENFPWGPQSAYDNALGCLKELLPNITDLETLKKST